MTTAKIRQTETGRAEDTKGVEAERTSTKPDSTTTLTRGQHDVQRPEHQGFHDREADPESSVFLGTSAGRTGYFHDAMRDRLDDRNLVRDAAERSDTLPTDKGGGKEAHRTKLKAAEFEKYKENFKLNSGRLR